jgi:hypothetical protein
MLGWKCPLAAGATGELDFRSSAHDGLAARRRCWQPPGLTIAGKFNFNAAAGFPTGRKTHSFQTPSGSALIFGSRQCRLASTFTSLARGRGLATCRAPFSSQCALLTGCEFSFGFGLHGLPFFLSGEPASRTMPRKVRSPRDMERSRGKCATHSRRRSNSTLLD